MPLELSEATQVRMMLDENRHLLEEIKKNTERTRKYILWSQVFLVVRMLIIILPLIAGVIFLRPFFKEAGSAYEDIIGSGALEVLKSLK